MPTGSRPPSSGPSERDRGLTWSRLRLGGALLAGLVLACVAIFFLDVVAREIAAGPRLVVSAEEARELEAGAQVWVSGVPAGRVTHIRFRPTASEGKDRILIRAELRGDAARLLRSDATATVREPALLEPAVLALRTGAASAPFDPSDTLRAVPQTDVDDVLRRADSLMSRLGTLRPDARRLARRLEEGPGTLAALRADDATAARLMDALREGRALARDAREGSAARLAADSGLRVRWDRIGRRSKRILATAGEAAAVADALDRLTGRLFALEARLDSSRGTLGRMMGDDALQRERKLLEARLDSVRAELMADPLRWLRFRLF